MSDVTEQYWTWNAPEALACTQSTLQGLTSEQAHARKARLVDCELEQKRPSRLALLVSQFNSPIVLLLLATAMLSFMVDDVTNGCIVMIIVGLSGALSYWQERSAADAVSELLKVIDSPVLVRRDGRSVTVARNALVPGDILVVRAGTVIAADCRLLECNALLVNEAALTGESFPSEKQPAAIDASSPLAKRSNCLFLGTHVVTGTGLAVVLRVGKQTELGKISNRLEARPTNTAFELGLRKFGSLLVRITAWLVAAVFIANLALQRPIVDSLMFALALAVGMTPQLLPAITSVVLAKGAKLMALREVIVKRLVTIENFGSMDTLCMDKTGTITSGRIALHEAFDLTGKQNLDVLRLALLNARLQQGFENPIDSAIVEAANEQKLGLDGAQCLAEVPYDFQRKRVSILVQHSSSTTREIITKGAFRNVLEICEHARLRETLYPIAEVRPMVEEQFARWSEQGYRVLGLATAERNVDSLSISDETHLTLVGMLAFADPLKPGIVQTLSELRNLELDLKLVTGDNAVVARSLAHQAGFTQLQIITGDLIDGLSQSQLAEQASRANVFAEIEPNQKEKIVTALRQAGRVVGFLGDGINDAPALHASDVGISVSSAVDVAREAAQVVLLRPDLNVLLAGVREGRRTLANTLKYIYFAISANFGYMLSMAIASIFLPFLPLLPSQILLINLLADFPAMALASDLVDAESIRRPRHWDMAPIVRFMLMFGLAGTCCDLITFWTLLNVFHTTPELFRSGWFTVSVLTGILILLVIRTPRPFLLSRPGKWLIISAAVVIALALYLPYSPLGTVLELPAPTLKLYGAIGMICSFYVVLLECLKHMILRRSLASAHFVER